MKRTLTALLGVAMTVTPVIAQTVIFEEDFESGTPSSDWEIYRAGEEAIQAVAMTDAPATLEGGGSYVGMVWDEDVTYAGSAPALAGDADLQNYTIEADVYCYVNHPNGSAYTGLIVYGDSSHIASADTGFFYKFVADFDADNRFRLYNNQLAGFSYTFHEPIDATGLYEDDAWHHMKFKVETVGEETHFTCWFDGTEVGKLVDGGADQHGMGKFGMWSFQNNYGIPGYFDNIRVTSNEPVSVDEETTSLPSAFRLFRNFPNPFNARTAIEFEVNRRVDATLDIYNIHGQLVKSLLRGHLEPKRYSVIWNGTDDQGEAVPTGVYIYRLSGGAHRVSDKMILLK